MGSQSWQAERYSKHASFVAELGSPLISLLSPVSGERILDLGCGDGALTEKLVKQYDVSVLGVDLSQSMVADAREKGLDAAVMNGEYLTFDKEFDAVLSNAALHWMADYQSVIKGVHAALKPSGRFVGEFGGSGNIQCLINAIRDVLTETPELGKFSMPWYFPTVEAYTDALVMNGFRVNSIALIPRPTLLKSGVREWFKIFADYIVGDLDGDRAEVFLTAVEARVRPSLFSEEEGWMADYVRLRFSASKV